MSKANTGAMLLTMATLAMANSGGMLVDESNYSLRFPNRKRMVFSDEDREKLAALPPGKEKKKLVKELRAKYNGGFGA